MARYGSFGGFARPFRDPAGNEGDGNPLALGARNTQFDSEVADWGGEEQNAWTQAVSSLVLLLGYRPMVKTLV